MISKLIGSYFDCCQGCFFCCCYGRQFVVFLEVDFEIRRYSRLSVGEEGFQDTLVGAWGNRQGREGSEKVCGVSLRLLWVIVR